MVLKSIAILLMGTALGTGLQYVGAPNRTSGSVETNGIASPSDLHRESIVTVNNALSPFQTMESASLGASMDNSHIDWIRRAHTAIRDDAVSDLPPTF
jgi:hypothetical protein